MAVKISLNKKQLMDKIWGCWVGKNIGGTLGAPYEGKSEINNITGFASQKGEPLPNDDLDLQLIWLRAMQETGPKSLDANVLADYWLSCITPHWNEYGIGKSNLERGILPPLSGEVNNDVWKCSNGAWIRSEIWACLAPGVPNVAVKYAIYDACIDHGLSEGTYAEMFTAALESMAFFETDIRVLIDKALDFVPSDCRIAKCVKLVLDSYDKKIPWIEVRQMLVEDNADIGWFQAPANIGYVVLGLVYGEGDFKQSLIYCVNCGDDTDCTAATCGAILGIMYGEKGLPEDWKEYIGDRIVTCCINASYKNEVPKNCTQLTEMVLETLPGVLNEYGIDFEYTDGENVIDKEAALSVLDGYSAGIMERSPYSFEINSPSHTDVVVEYEKEPFVKPGDEFRVKVSFTNHRGDPFFYELEALLPEGWSADYKKNCFITQITLKSDGKATWEMTVHVGENVATINKIIITATAEGHVVPVMIPMVLLG